MSPYRRIMINRILGTSIAVLSVMIIFFPKTIWAKRQIEFTPSISIRETYDDNINLDNTNKESDYITIISPSFELHVQSENSDLGLIYSPGFVRYEKNSEDDTVRHSGTLNFNRKLTEYLSFNLADTYLQSEDPLEETEGIEGTRKTRNTYQRNNGEAEMTYAFGDKNTMTAGYGHSLVKNTDVTIDDSTTQDAFGRLTYWLHVKNGFELDYRYTRADFRLDDDSEAGDDYSGHMTGIKYLYIFTPHTTGSIGYNFTNRNFEGLSEDYEVHDISLGFQHSFSKDLSISTSGGFFTQKNDRSADETGLNYSISINKAFDLGSFTFGGQGGWDEGYQEAERRGFTKFLGLNSRIEYQLLEKLNGYVGASYRQNKDPDDKSWKTWRGNCGLRWSFLRWYSLSLDYSYDERDDDVNTEDYKDNRLMLMLSTSKLFKW